jgi:cytochrome c oxidase subunit 2
MDAVFAPASADAAIITQMAWVLVAGAALIFGGVMLLMALGLRRRGGSGGKGGQAGSRFRPGLWIVGGGLLLPVAVLSALMAYNVRRSTQLDPQTSRGALVVAVTAKMWWWEVRYSDPAGGQDIVLANEIHLPAGRPAYLALTSADVIHSFWVPALGGKMDMVPGRMTGLSLRPLKPGVYRGQCAEYCGLQHARMALHVVVEPAAGFDAWLAQQARPQPLPSSVAPETRLAAGRRVFEQHCAACHAVRTTVASKAAAANISAPAAAATPAGAPLAPPLQLTGVGPDLTHVASRLYLAAGLVA